MMFNEKDCREAFSSTVIKLAKQNDNIVVVCNDSVGSSNMTEFEEIFPDRIFNVGIAEQNMIGVAAGLANAGFCPVVCAASCFLCARAYEQIKIDIGYSEANVKMFAVSPGFAYGALGATHHSPEDIALMSSIPNISIAVPSDFSETKLATEVSIGMQGPTFVRVLRTPVADLSMKIDNFVFGKSSVLKCGGDVLFVANGLMTHHVLDAAAILEKDGLDCGVINASSVQPFDRELIVSVAKAYQSIVVVEEANVIGGLGSKVAEALSFYGANPVLQIGVSEFAPTGSTEEILKYFDLDAEGIARRTNSFVQQLRNSGSAIAEWKSTG